MTTSLANEVRYDLVRQISAGGMGVVYEAVQMGAGNFRKRVAIKIIREEYSRMPSFQGNFIGEARLAAELVHPNIVQTYHLGRQQDGRYFIAMEYIDGPNLEDLIAGHAALRRLMPLEMAVHVISRIACALAYAHRKRDLEGRPLGIVHRDLNPRNILIAEEGVPKLSDFGTAKAHELMHSGEGRVIAGRDEYLSPEQAGYAVTDARADLFPLGILLSELLLGYNIFRAANPVRSRHNILALPVPRFSTLRADIDEGLENILQRMLRRDRDLRYQSARELHGDLDAYLFGDRNGLTNEKFSAYVSDLMGRLEPAAPAGCRLRGDLGVCAGLA